MKSVTLLGIGSPQGMDRVGWQVVEHFKQYHLPSLPAGAHIQVMACDRPGLTLLDHIQHADLAVLVDAMQGGDVGAVHCLQASQLMADEETLSSHQAGVAEALALGDKLNMLPPHMLVYGVATGDEVRHSAIDDAAIRCICARIATDITTWLRYRLRVASRSPG